MGKNVHGGNNHKKFARKHATGRDSRLIVSTDPLEVYAVATKILGNRMFYCLCIDGVTRLGHIRGKFAGRGKSGNMVALNTWLLVGLRELTIDSKNSDGAAGAVAVASTTRRVQEECDLMEVYGHTDRPRLQSSQPNVRWSVLINADTSRITGDTSDDGLFATEQDTAREEMVALINASNTSAAAVIRMDDKKEDEDDAFNLDDI